MDVRPARIEGRVERQLVAPGSKSERRAVVLRVRSGQTFVLRRKNGPAFGDSELEALVGHSIDAEGLAAGGDLIMDHWRVVD